jgi:hypothetical protein
MEKTVKFHPAQEVPSGELNLFQDYARTSFDETIKNLLVRSVYYKGMTLTKVSATEISVDAGRLWSGGACYVRETLANVSLISYLPGGSNKKILAIVASGQTSDEEAASRKFLIDPNTRTVRARTVETRNERNVVVSIVDGIASTNPVAPLIDVGYALIGYVTLSSTGIVGDPAQDTAMVAPNLEDLVATVQILDAELDLQLGMIRTLRTDLSALAAKVAGLATKAEIQALWEYIKGLKLGVILPPPTSSTFTNLDEFNDVTKSDTAHGSYLAEVLNGRLAVPRPASTSQIATLLNPIDTRVKIHADNGILLPDYDVVKRFANADKADSVAISTYPVVTQSKTKKYHSIMLKYYKMSGLGINKAIEQFSGNVELINPETGIKMTVDLRKYTWRRDSDTAWGCWIYIEDWEPYWDVSTTSVDVTGSSIAQTFLNAQAGWFVGASVQISRLGGSGDLRMILCECKPNGEPDLTKTLEDVLLGLAYLQSEVSEGTNDEKGWVQGNFPPVHLSGGKQYALVLQTTGDHRVHCSTGNTVANGNLFYATNATTWASLGKDLSFKLKFASFKSTFLPIELGSISLAGGMDSIDFVFTGVKPGAVGLDMQAQVGGVWGSIDGTIDTILASKPALVPLRMVFKSTKDDAVGVVLSKSRILAHRPSLSGVHISTADDPTGTCSTVVVKEILAGYDAGVHTHAIKLLHGASFATTKTADATVVTTLPNGNKEYKATFNVTTLGEWKVRTEMGLSDSGAEYVVLSRETYAQ